MLRSDLKDTVFCQKNQLVQSKQGEQQSKGNGLEPLGTRRSTIETETVEQRVYP